MKKNNCISIISLALLSLLVSACANGSSAGDAGNANSSRANQVKKFMEAHPNYTVQARPGFARVLSESELDAMIAQHSGKQLTATQAKALSVLSVNKPMFRAVAGGMIAESLSTFPGMLGAAVFDVNGDDKNKAGFLLGSSGSPYTILNPAAFNVIRGKVQGGNNVSFSFDRAFESTMFGMTAGASASGFGASMSSQVSYLTETQETATSMTITANSSIYEDTSIKPIELDPEEPSSYIPSTNQAQIGAWVNASGLCDNTTINFAKWDGTTCEKNLAAYDTNSVLPYKVVHDIWDYTGNAYVDSVKEGILFVTTIQLKFKDKQSKDKFSLSLKAGYNSGATSANIFASIQQSQAATKTSMNMSVSTYQWGGMPLLAAHVLDHVSSCDMSTQASAIKCKNIIDDVSAYITNEESYGLVYQYEHPEKYPKYIFPSVSGFTSYKAGGLDMYGKWMKRSGNTQVARYVNAAGFWDGNIMPTENSKRTLDGVTFTNIFDTATSVGDFIGKEQQIQYSINGYNNNTDAQKSLWGSMEKFNVDKDKINRFVTNYIDFVGSTGNGVYVPDGSGNSVIFRTGLRNMMMYPSSYSLANPADPGIGILYMTRLIAAEYNKNYAVDTSILNTIQNNSFILGTLNQAYAKGLPNFMLLPAEKFESSAILRRFIISSLPIVGGVGNPDIQADQFGQSDIYLRSTQVKGKPGIELFGQITYAKDNSLNYQPYGMLPYTESGNTINKVAWNSNVCSDWSNNQIYILPGSRIKFGIQATAINPSAKNLEEQNIKGAYHNNVGANMFPTCAGDLNSGDIKCGDRAFFAYYARPLSTNGSDACMRALIKMQDLFRTLTRVNPDTFLAN